MNHRAGTLRRILKIYRGKAGGKLWTLASRRTLSSTVNDFTIKVPQNTTANTYKYKHFNDFRSHCRNRTNLKLTIVSSVCCIPSHQWNYIQSEGPEDVHQPACVLAPDQHGISQRLQQHSLPWTDIPS